MSCKRSNMMNAQQRKNMTELLELISTGNNEELTHEKNMYHLRNSFARDETRNISTTGGSPRRSQKYTVDTTLSAKNAARASGVHPDNANAPDFITGSARALFEGSTQTERCQSESVRGPMQRVKGF